MWTAYLITILLAASSDAVHVPVKSLIGTHADCVRAKEANPSAIVQCRPAPGAKLVVAGASK